MPPCLSLEVHLNGSQTLLWQWYLISTTSLAYTTTKNSLSYYSNTKKYIMLPALGDEGAPEGDPSCVGKMEWWRMWQGWDVQTGKWSP
jgi:hypothetical protein